MNQLTDKNVISVLQCLYMKNNTKYRDVVEYFRTQYYRKFLDNDKLKSLLKNNSITEEEYDYIIKPK